MSGILYDSAMCICIVYTIHTPCRSIYTVHALYASEYTFILVLHYITLNVYHNIYTTLILHYTTLI